MKIKEDSSNYAVVAIDTDRVRQRSIKALLDQLRCQLKKDNIKEIVLVMASGEEKIPELLLNNKYRVYSFYPRKDLSHQEKVTLQLLISINQYINQHNYSVDDDINWKKIAGQLSNRIPEAMSDKDREDKCTKVVNEFFRKVGKNCAKAGLLKIDQMIVDKCDEQALNQEFEPLDKKLEDFILHGQPELTRFFRHHVIQQLLKPELFKLYNLYFPQSFLLYGAPGTGKTHALKALAMFLDLTCYEINPETVGSKWVDQCEQNIAEVFEQAGKAKGAIIIIDEIDSMLPNRNNTLEIFVKRTNELLRHIEKANESHIIVAGTTNRLEALDPAALREGRLGTLFEVSGLDRDGVQALLVHQLQRFMDKDNALSLAPAVDYLGNGCPVANVYGFCRGLCSYAATQQVHPLNQQLLEQYVSQESGKLKGKAKNPATIPPPLPPKPGKRYQELSANLHWHP
ncbi:ATP-binding protein [Endozoicomonas sp. SCSIO W0465]|uniref:ATP-binding protein n=1 Tax=Endozoicomonas sp. SCSIO W0465 TaxID=2918516 RepID=UPI0020765DC2|nr:ATP-binding protein [Endozoicomonas sp. SCSIO W0465]USE35610.1 AAA family ATPase [Endozoicomonas sp. SCSIO W0465]